MSELVGIVSAQLVNEDFAERLSVIRRGRGISQAALGERLGVSRGTISNLESGSQNVQLHQLFSLANVLDTPVSEFLPTLDSVVVYEDSARKSDRLFLEISKRQLVDLEVIGDDD